MPTDAFILRGIARVYIVPAVIVLTAPTRAEINAGTNVTSSVAGISGFAIENQIREVAPVGATFVEQSTGVNKVSGPCSLVLYEKKTTTTLRTAVAVGTGGFVILVPYGDVTGRRCEVWPTKVASLVPPWDFAGASVFRVVFAIRAAPTQNAVLPA
jgi:hypothetical protein